MEKLTKADLKRPDLFMQETTRFADWASKHQKTLVGILAFCLLSGVVWTVWGLYSSSQEEKAQAALYEAEKLLKKLEPAQQTPPGSAPTPAKESDIKSAVEALKKVVAENSGTQAAVFAALELSKINYAKGLYADSIPVLEMVRNRAKDPAVKGMVLYSLANNYASSGDCNKAIDVWNQVEARDDLHFMLGSAYLEKGLCFETLGQKDKAEQVYKKAEGMGKNPEVARLAKKYLKLLK